MPFLRLSLIWSFCALIAIVSISLSQFQSSSNDSKYYSILVERYNEAPWEVVLTPKWGENYWNFDPTTYIRDHFPGQTILGIAISRLGVPPKHALHALGFLFQIGSLFLLVAIAATFLQFDRASSLFWGLLLIPPAFSHGIRANHEGGVLFFCLLAMFSGLRLIGKSGASLLWLIPIVGSSFFLFWIKGPLFVFAPLFSVLALWAWNRKLLWKEAFTVVLLSFAVVFLTAVAFEFYFKNVTGESFFSEFWGLQIHKRSIVTAATEPFLVRKFLNFCYYLSRYFIYSAPWSLLLIVLFIRSSDRKAMSRRAWEFLKSPPSICLLGGALIMALAFSVSDRTASRYVFPGFYLFSSWAILLLLHLSVGFQKIHQRILAFGLHRIAPWAWLLIIEFHLLFRV